MWVRLEVGYAYWQVRETSGASEQSSVPMITPMTRVADRMAFAFFLVVTTSCSASGQRPMRADALLEHCEAQQSA